RASQSVDSPGGNHYAGRCCVGIGWGDLELCNTQTICAPCGRRASPLVRVRNLATRRDDDVLDTEMNFSQMSFDNGILHLANWAGNVIMPTLAALFIIAAILQFSKGQEFSHSMYGALACVMVSGLTRAFETFASQRAWNNPDVYWLALLTAINWVGNVILPVYAAAQVAIGALRIGMFSYIHPTSSWMRHFLAAGLCLMVSGLLRLAEFFVTHGTAGVTEQRRIDGSRSNAGVPQPPHAGNVCRSRSRRLVRHPGRSRGDEHRWEISESGDVWPAHEHGAAVHRSHPECPGADAVQVRQAARLPLGLGDVSHQAACLFGA